MPADLAQLKNRPNVNKEWINTSVRLATFLNRSNEGITPRHIPYSSAGLLASNSTRTQPSDFDVQSSTFKKKVRKKSAGKNS